MALTNTIASEALHGDISQHQRERTLNGFRQGKFTVLVATDVASRGLDIPNVDLVKSWNCYCYDYIRNLYHSFCNDYIRQLCSFRNFLIYFYVSQFCVF
jgi:hypothetical protein